MLAGVEITDPRPFGHLVGELERILGVSFRPDNSGVFEELESYACTVAGLQMSIVRSSFRGESNAADHVTEDDDSRTPGDPAVHGSATSVAATLWIRLADTKDLQTPVEVDLSAYYEHLFGKAAIECHVVPNM